MRKRNNIASLLIVFLLLSFLASSQPQRDFMLMFYNVENLYDTIDNPQKDDNEFLPTSERRWNSYRYHKKLTNISKVIATAGGWQLPDIVAMCEVENDTCLHDLLTNTELYRFHYNIIQFDSEDLRGIDVALLYNIQTFSPLSQRPIRIQFTSDSSKKTRDVLYVSGIMKTTNDTLHLFVCHFPSRRGGKEASEPFRMEVAKEVRTKIDSIFSSNPKANILVTGDFNDYPNDKSITEGLQAKKHTELCNKCLVSLQDPNADGTYKFQGQWNFLDQAIVSSGFLERYKIDYTVVTAEGLLETNEKTGEKTPFRTYRGPYYHGGISDHLPITTSFTKK